MQKWLLTVMAAVCLSSSSEASASVTGIESFEASWLDDWTVSVEYSPYFVQYFTADYTPTDYPFDPLTNPYIQQDIELVDSSSAPDGDRYLQLTVGGGSTGHHSEPRSFTGPDGETYIFLDRSYRVLVSRDLELEAGNTVSLFANFYTEDSPPFDADDLRVSINASTVFELSVADVYKGVPEGWESGWTNVLWTAPANGTYTLSLSSFQDDQAFSSASFDYVGVIPEPTTLAFLGLGSLALVVRRR